MPAFGLPHFVAVTLMWTLSLILTVMPHERQMPNELAMCYSHLGSWVAVKMGEHSSLQVHRGLSNSALVETVGTAVLWDERELHTWVFGRSGQMQEGTSSGARRKPVDPTSQSEWISAAGTFKLKIDPVHDN